MGAIKPMDQILNILKTYQRTRSIKATVKAEGCARNTIRSYLRLAAARDPDLNVVLKLPDDQLRQVFFPGTPAAAFDREADFALHFDGWAKELIKTGVTRQLLWEEYLERVPQGYRYTRWCNLFREQAERRNLTMALEHRPGDLLQFDYAGATLPWVDKVTGEVHQAQVLLAVFPFSQYTFAIALPSQRTADFAHGIVRALSFFGGLPRGIVSDNLKAFVIEPHRYEPTFNQLSEQLGHHYEIDLQATRPRRPKDKAAVEGGVKTIYTRLYAPLRNRLFTSVEQINAAFLEQLADHNAKPFKKRSGSRLSVFTEQESPLLKSLPTTPFLPKTTVTAKVSLSYHVYLSERGNYYSVPHRYVGKIAEVVYSPDLVEIYLGPDRVATPRALPPRRPRPLRHRARPHAQEPPGVEAQPGLQRRLLPGQSPRHRSGHRVGRGANPDQPLPREPHLRHLPGGAALGRKIRCRPPRSRRRLSATARPGGLPTAGWRAGKTARPHRQTAQPVQLDRPRQYPGSQRLHLTCGHGQAPLWGPRGEARTRTAKNVF